MQCPPDLLASNGVSYEMERAGGTALYRVWVGGVALDLCSWRGRYGATMTDRSTGRSGSIAC